MQTGGVTVGEMAGSSPESRLLIVVKHAAPAIRPEVPAAAWRLSEPGRAAGVALADRLAAFAPVAVVASEEPKAAETARIVAEHLRLPFETAPDLHEHDRTGVPFLGAAEWRARIRRFFAKPDELALGRETARAAGDRFARAVTAVLDRHPTGNLAIVAHGTVISLFVARSHAVEPFELWEQLGMPSFVVVVLPEFELTQIVPEV